MFIKSFLEYFTIPFAKLLRYFVSYLLFATMCLFITLMRLFIHNVNRMIGLLYRFFPRKDQYS